MSLKRLSLRPETPLLGTRKTHVRVPRGGTAGDFAD